MKDSVYNDDVPFKEMDARIKKRSEIKFKQLVF